MPAISRTIGTDGLNVQEWTAATAMDLETFGNIPTLLNPSNWREWAFAVIGLASLSGIVLPNPNSFDEWRDWANNFNAVLEGRQ
jgi:hypothetical protein